MHIYKHNINIYMKYMYKYVKNIKHRYERDTKKINSYIHGICCFYYTCIMIILVCLYLICSNLLYRK